MPDVQEVFRMSTQKVQPDPGALERQHTKQRRQSVGKKVGAFAVAAAIAVAALIAIAVATRNGGSTSVPADQTSPTFIVEPTDAAAMDAATGFLKAFGANDADRAISFLAPGADLSNLSDPATRDGLMAEIRWNEATSFETHGAGPCEQTGSNDIETSIRCGFDWQGLRSGEMGLGPYGGGQFVFAVRDGQIVRVSMDIDYESEFSGEVWEPFAKWVSKNYPADAEVMYTNGSLTNYSTSDQSIRLWGKRTREYEQEVGQS